MLHLTQIPSLGQGGLITGIAALVAISVSRGVPIRAPKWLPAATATCVVLALLIEALLSTWYLFSPTFIDHIEASTASTTHYFMQGKAVYPSLDSFTFHGLLYGPLLPELNSLGYLVAGGILASKLIGWAACWLALGVIALVTAPRDRNWAWFLGLVAGGCVVCSFGSIMTANRADSVLLLFAAVALWSVVRLPLRVSLPLAGLLVGLAAGLKLHGPAYILPAFGWLAGRYRQPPPARGIFLAAAVTAIAALAPFLAPNIDAGNYFNYLRLGAKHGLDPLVFLWGCTFLLCLWVPPLLAAGALRSDPKWVLPRQTMLFVAVLLPVELAVTVIAAKPGAGTHHMLPFVGYHCFLLTQLLQSNDAERPAAQAAAFGVALVLLGTSWSTALAIRASVTFELQRPVQRVQLAELLRFADAYPHGMLGIAGNESYRLTMFRPWLTLRGNAQTDFGAWMDWNLSGISDRPLATALETCTIPHLFVPIGGEPFSLINTYGAGLAFSDQVRAAFAEHYQLIQSGKYFNVYGCRRIPAPPLPRGPL